MSIARLPKPIYIARPTALHRLVNTLMGQRVVAVDTESNSLHAFREQVCLIQISTPQNDYLIDPLALNDLQPLAPFFSSNKIKKIFHAAEYDIICLKRDFGYEIKNLFDTMIAARILSREAIGLGAIIKDEFGVEVDKRFQRANWGRRPLPEQMLAYAQLDTHFLIQIRQRFEQELKARKLWSLALEDFKRLYYVSTHSTNHRPPDCWRIRGAHDIPPQNAAVLQELCNYRKQVAQSIDRPLFKVLGNQTLLTLAVNCPRDEGALRGIPGMSQRQIERHGQGILTAIRHGLEKEPLFPPKPPRPNDAFLARLEDLRSWRKEAARQMGVKSDVVLPRDLMIALAEANPRDSRSLAKVLHEVPWRLEHFGSQILAVLQKS